MYERLDLNGADWQLRGYLGHYWLLPGNVFWADRPAESDQWMPATVPGMVQTDLIREGRIPDPYIDLNSLPCEWVSQRDWVYRKTFLLPESWRGRRLRLRFGGVDYRCHVSLNGTLLGIHEGTCLPFEFDVTGTAVIGGENRLIVAVHRAPDADSQIGHTSKTAHFKPRFAYGWDFAPRAIPLGIWQDVDLVASGPVVCSDLWVRPAIDGNTGRVKATLRLDGPAPEGVAAVWSILRGDTVLAGGTEAVTPGASETIIQTALERPAIWWTNGLGDQPLHEIRVDLIGPGGARWDTRAATFGFRDLTWVRTEGAPEDALAYQPVLNGVTVPVRGWNWVPLSNFHGGEIDDRYDRFIALARRAGVNLIRVWGGGILEKTRFYEACDRAGILVWQELQMSSSGVDNEAPSDPAFCEAFEAYARAILPQRRNHVSLAVWCGGNELCEGYAGPPHALSHPVIAALRHAVDDLDPGRHLLPTSGSGPDGMLRGDNLTHVLHDVHGPWTYAGPEAQYTMANTFTAMLHSEFGAPGAAHAKTLRAIAPEDRILPPSFANPLWRHRGDWWIHEDQVRALFGEWDSLETFVRFSQFIQFEGLRYLVESNHRKWPRCAGAIPWQFNEPWPCTSCTCSVDYYGSPKPAYYAVARVYRPVHVSLCYDHLAPSRRGGWRAPVVATLSAPRAPLDAELYWTVADLHGGTVAAGTVPVTARTAGSHAVCALPDEARCDVPVLVALRLRDAAGGLLAANDYLFGGGGVSPLFGAVRECPRADVAFQWQADGVAEIRNNGPAPALWVEVADAGEPGTRPAFFAGDSYFCLLPGESRVVRLDGVTAGGQATVRGWNTATLPVAPGV